MVAPVTVKEKDLRTLLGIVGDDRSDLPAEGLPVSLLAELADQVRRDVLSVLASIPASSCAGSGRSTRPTMAATRPVTRCTGRTFGTARHAATRTAAVTCAA
jgi:hypothetical protein